MSTVIDQSDVTNINTNADIKHFKPLPKSSERLFWSLFATTLFLIDTLMVLIAFAITFVFISQVDPNSATNSVDEQLIFYTFFSLATFLAPLWLLTLAVSGLYNQQKILNGFEEYRMIFRATSIGMLAILIARDVVTSNDPEAFIILNAYTGEWIFGAWVLTILFVCLGRFFMRRVAYILRRRGLFLTNTLIIGYNDETSLLYSQLARSNESGLNIIGFVIPPEQTSIIMPTHASEIKGTTDALDGLIFAYNVGELILSTKALTQAQVIDLFKRYGTAEHINMRMSSGLFEVITTGIEVKEVVGVPLTRINKQRLTGGELFIKSVIDWVLALMGVVFAGPLLLAIALAIELDSSGPAIHRRRVLGLNGEEFDAFKFRTMHVNGDEILAQHPELKAELEREHKLKDDPRVTRIGKYLRKFSLDELPQLLNVLRWEMSLVGPRMIAPKELDMYQQWDVNLLTVKPGITGYWQVNGRSDVSYEERVRMDMYYIRNWSILLDLEILVKTITVVLYGRGAY